jgi:hypothetical protein
MVPKSKHIHINCTIRACSLINPLQSRTSVSITITKEKGKDYKRIRMEHFGEWYRVPSNMALHEQICTVAPLAVSLFATIADSVKIIIRFSMLYAKPMTWSMTNTPLGTLGSSGIKP